MGASGRVPPLPLRHSTGEYPVVCSVPGHVTSNEIIRLVTADLPAIIRTYPIVESEI